MAKRKKISNRREDSEREVTRKHLGDFKSKGSLGESLVQQISPEIPVDWTKHALTALGLTFSNTTGEPFHRDFMRGRELIYKWLTDNYDKFRPLVPMIRIE